MPLSAQQIKEKLLSAIDQDANVVDMGHVLEAIHVLEKTFIPKESLEETRLGKLVNDIRKKSADRELTNRCRKLVRQWQKQHLKNSNGSSNSPQANQRTPISSAVAVVPAASNPASSDALSLVQEGASTQPSVDKTNPANRKRRKAEWSSPREGQPSAKLVKPSKVNDSANGIPRDSSGKTVKSNLKKTNEIKNKHAGLGSNQKLSKCGQPVSNLSPSISKRTPSPNITSLENAKRLPKVKSSNSLGSAEGSKSTKSSPCLLKPGNRSRPSSALGRLKTSPGCSPKSSFPPKVSNILKDEKRNNTISPALVSDSHPRRKDTKISCAAPSQSIFDDDSEVKTKSIFDEDDGREKSTSIFDDDDDHRHVSVDGSVKSDEKLELSHTHSLIHDADVANDATVYTKNNQDFLDKNSFLFGSKHVEDDVSCSQNVVYTESNVNALRTSPSLESHVDTSLSSWSMKPEYEAAFPKTDTIDEPVRIVTEGEIDRIHTTQWSGVNGCYDSKSQWHSWSDSYSIPHDNCGDNALHILPYVCLD